MFTANPRSHSTKTTARSVQSIVSPSFVNASSLLPTTYRFTPGFEGAGLDGAEFWLLGFDGAGFWFGTLMSTRGGTLIFGAGCGCDCGGAGTFMLVLFGGLVVVGVTNLPGPPKNRNSATIPISRIATIARTIPVAKPVPE